MNSVHPNFFQTIKWPNGKHPQEKCHLLGRAGEWFFDFGQKSYSVNPKKLDQNKIVTIENSKISKSFIKKICCVFEVIIKLFLTITVIPALVCFLAKFIYRQKNPMIVDSTPIHPVEKKVKSDDTELREAEIIGGIYSENELEKYFLELDSKIEHFQIENFSDLQSLCELYRDLYLHDSLLKSFITQELQKKYPEAKYFDSVIKKSETLIRKFQEKINVQFEHEYSDLRIYFSTLELLLLENRTDPNFLSQYENEINTYLQTVHFLSTISKTAFYHENLVSELIRLTTPKGIPNVGNSCYMNSALQSILTIPYFKNLLSSEKNFKRFSDVYTNKSKINSRIPYKFRDFIFKTNVITGNKREQNDPAQLLDGLLSNTDYGLELVNYFLKDKDNDANKKFEREMLLRVSFKENHEKGPHRHSFQDLINREFSHHTYDENDRVSKLNSAPEYMVVQLLRFGNSLEKHREELFFNHGENIDFREAMHRPASESYIYEPCAVIYHLGNSIQSGHYIADVKCGGTWFNCNDNVVTPKGLFNPNIGNGYVYIFKRKN